MPKPTKTRAARRAPARAKRAQTTALARRKSSIPSTGTKGKVEVLPAVEPVERTLAEGINIGTLGLVELKLTDKEEEILARPITLDDTRIMIKPTGAAYMAHADYSRWFSEAFGRTGWQLVPVGKPIRQENVVLIPYILHVHRQPVAFAWGEHEYQEKNREQTYGDVVEATVANAMRRCAKRLGVGLELWDRRWLDEFVRRNAVRVRCNLARRGQPEDLRWLWRLKSDPPLRGELRRGQGDGYEDEDFAPAQREEAPPPARQRREVERHEPAHHDARSADKISEKQARRLWTIVQNSGRTEEDVKTWLLRRFKVSRYDDVLRRDYEFVWQTIESPINPLPEGK